MPLRALILAGVCLAAAARGGEGGAPDRAALLQPFVDHHALAGAVTLAATGVRTLSCEAVGSMDLAAHAPNRTDCLFWIASMSKPLTATALMMLVDEGKVALDEAVARYLPEFAGQLLAADAEHPQGHAPAHPLTVRMLLDHTGGLPFLAPAEHGKIDGLPLREAVAGYARLALRSEPGTRYQYSNCGIDVVGRIIEVVRGLPYEDFMAQRLLAPLAMRDTSCWPDAAQLRRLARSYRPAADQAGLEEIPIAYLAYPLDDHRRGPCPGGGYFPTAGDLLAFCRMILAGGVAQGRRYLSPVALAEMTGRQAGALDAAYGLGWQTPAPGLFGHGGAYGTDLAIDRPHGLITILLAQHDGYANGDGGRILPAFKAAALSELAR